MHGKCMRKLRVTRTLYCARRVETASGFAIKRGLYSLLNDTNSQCPNLGCFLEYIFLIDLLFSVILFYV